jgi:hypothetical protein
LIGPELEENLALRYIHAAVEQAGHEPRILDFHDASQIPALVGQVIAWQPDVVGMSMVFTARALEYVQLAEALRRAGYGGHITAGGHFASFNAEKLLEDVPAIDSVLHGEGEQALPALLAGLDRAREVAGITLRADGARMLTNAAPPPTDDLDAIAFPTRSPRYQSYLGMPIANVLSGRGCFADCDFCSINAWHRRIGGRRFRQRSVENLVAEMALLYHRDRVRIFNFHDDNFFLPTESANVARFGAIRDALRRHGAGPIAIQVKARPDTVCPGSMEILKQIGLFRVFLGVESNAVAGLKALGRGIDRDVNHQAVRLLKNLDVHVTCNLLMFEPDCLPADVRDNIGFMREHADIPLNFCRTEVYAGTKLEARLRAAGRLRGDYFGFNYTIADPRSQLAYELFRQVFTPRNFHYDGTNLRGMMLDYHFHLLRRFRPKLADRGLRERLREWLVELNTDNAGLMDRICDFAENSAAATPAIARAFGDRLSRERARVDRRLAGQSDELLWMMQARAASPPRTVRCAWSKAVAGVALLATVMNTHCTEMAPHTTEMAPTGPGLAPNECVPEPFSQPAQADDTSRERRRTPQPPPTALPAAEVPAVQRFIESPDVHQTLIRAAGKHAFGGRTVSVTLDVAAGGVVTGAVVDLPERELAGFRQDLQRIVRGWKIAGIASGGRCTIHLRFLPQPGQPRKNASPSTGAGKAPGEFGFDSAMPEEEAILAQYPHTTEMAARDASPSDREGPERRVFRVMDAATQPALPWRFPASQPARPGTPATLPAGTTQPTSRSAGDAMPARDLEVIDEQLATRPLGATVARLATRHGMAGQTLRVDLTVSKAGRVTKVRIALPDDRKPRFQQELARAFKAIRFGPLEKGGRCVLEVALLSEKRFEETETHIFEMAPRPRQER